MGSQLAFAHLGFWCNLNIIRRCTRLVSDLFRFISDSAYESVHNFSIPTTTPPASFFELLFDIRYKGFKQRGAKWMIITASSAQNSPDTFSSTLILILYSMYISLVLSTSFLIIPAFSIVSHSFSLHILSKAAFTSTKSLNNFPFFFSVAFLSHAVEYKYYPLSPFPFENLLVYLAAPFLFQSVFDPFIYNYIIYFVYGIKPCHSSTIFLRYPVSFFI